MNKKMKNLEKLASMDYVEFKRWSNKGLKGKGYKAYSISNGQTSRKWRFIKFTGALPRYY